MSKSLRFVGLDVHKNSIAIAVAEDGRGPAELYGEIPNDWETLRKTLRRLAKGCSLRCCYEAGPCGYGLYRKMKKARIQIVVVAPSLVPTQAGVRVKTDRRDARKLAHFLRSGDLVPIFVPDEQTEAIRDLERAREDAKKSERVARQQLGHFLLRHDRRWSKSNWTREHLDWIGRQKFEYPAQQRVLTDYIKAVEDATGREKQLTEDLAEVIKETSLYPLIKALQAFRGIRLITAVTIAAELADLKRFSSPRQLMAFLGLVPSEHSSGQSERRGRITRTGNAHVRRILTEAAWNYRYQPRMSKAIRKRNEGVSYGVQALAWKAQKRLHRRLQHLVNKGKRHEKAVTAVARELAGFVWAVGQEPELLANRPSDDRFAEQRGKRKGRVKSHGPPPSFDRVAPQQSPTNRSIQ
jgi:transposase